jgi:hypothetical protein
LKPANDRAEWNANGSHGDDQRAQLKSYVGSPDLDAFLSVASGTRLRDRLAAQADSAATIQTVARTLAHWE